MIITMGTAYLLQFGANNKTYGDWCGGNNVHFTMDRQVGRVSSVKFFKFDQLTTEEDER